ncbi:MAG: hypothetical protein IJC33_00525 [Clostridia bacterium]|nr:hypothetical protein [Clostridia bacterium]
MNNAKRILCSVLAVAMLLSIMLTGCSMPKITFKGTGDVAAHYGDTAISTGEYLAYLYNEFYSMYYNQGLYQYEMYGYDVWAETYPYGEGDNQEELSFSDYIIRAAQDHMKRQLALEEMMKEHSLSWIEEEVKDMDKEIAEMTKDAYVPLGISDENFIKVYKAIGLNERAVFFGLYGKDGSRAVADKDIREYFDKNYLSYKMISIPLTGSDGKELKDDEKKKIKDELNGYLEIFNKDKNFEAAMDAYNKANAEEGATVEASKDEDNRRNVDLNDIDENLAKAIQGIGVGTGQVVEYKSGGTTPTAAFIVRLSISEPAELYTDSYEAILSALKYDEFNKEVQEKADKVQITFEKRVVKKCKPENFLG